MQVRTGYPGGQPHTVGRRGAPALLGPLGWAATVGTPVTQRGHQHPGTELINRLYAARRQPDTTRAHRPRVRSRIIPARSLSTRPAISAILNHGIYLTERIEPREGPAPSPIPPDCASPGRPTRCAADVSTVMPHRMRSVRSRARSVRSFLTRVKGGLRPPRVLAGPVRSSLRCGRPARQLRA